MTGYEQSPDDFERLARRLGQDDQSHGAGCKGQTTTSRRQSLLRPPIWLWDLRSGPLSARPCFTFCFSIDGFALATASVEPRECVQRTRRQGTKLLRLARWR